MIRYVLTNKFYLNWCLFQGPCILDFYQRHNIPDDPLVPDPGWYGTTTGFPPLVPVNDPEIGFGVNGLRVVWPGPGVGTGVGMLPELQSGIRQQESAGSALSGQDDLG